MSTRGLERSVTPEEIDSAPAVSRMAVVGIGKMGRGIAICAAQHGIATTIYDVNEQALEVALRAADSHLGDLSANGSATSRIQATVSLAEAVGNVDVVVEAIPELLDVKAQAFEAIAECAGQRTVFATNTSHLSITDIAATSRRPEAFIGLHFFNPAPVMNLVEVIPAMQTADWALVLGLRLVRDLGKQPILSRDVAGFISTRGHVAQFLECARIVDDGIARAEDVDSTYRLGFGHPMGPLELADYIGLDVLLDIAEGMRREHGERFLAPPLLRRLVAAGHYGRKSGRGFYDYPTSAERPNT
jgi:3-hydroxybutyryl-CoA dehydrogenase